MPSLVKSFDPLLQKWFGATTRELLNELMNQPRFINLRQAALERRRESDDLNERHGATMMLAAHRKRIHQNAKRLSAQRKWGFQNASRALSPTHTERQLAA